MKNNKKSVFLSILITVIFSVMLCSAFFVRYSIYDNYLLLFPISLGICLVSVVAFFSFMARNRRFRISVPDMLISILVVYYIARYDYELQLADWKIIYAILLLILWYASRILLTNVAMSRTILYGGIVAIGCILSLWGVLQLHGFLPSNHVLFAITGPFYNPGPYSGYLAMIFPIGLGCLLESTGKVRYLWLVAFSLMLCILPAGMSRSAWMAVAISGIWVYATYRSWGTSLRKIGRKYKKRVFPAIIAGGMVLIIVGYALFQLKVDSANGRLLIWKVSVMAIVEKPLLGHGTGNFASAYGMAQEKYFSQKEFTSTEKLVAGSPEYAFNEYLQIAVEYGVLFLLVVLLIIVFCLWIGITEKRLSACAGLISVLVFAFSSYPMQIPGFAIAFYFLLAACVVGSSRLQILFFIIMIALLGSYYWKYNQYNACEEWFRYKMHYNIGAFRLAKEGYEKIYPELNDRGAFLFEYGHSLHKLKEYNSSTAILKEAMAHSCDPMILNIIGKNYQAIGKYEKAEEYFIRSTHRLPGRIYPYYLLAKLYAEPEYRHPEKLKQAIQIVLTKEPKVQSTAIREMREEVKLLK